MTHVAGAPVLIAGVQVGVTETPFAYTFVATAPHGRGPRPLDGTPYPVTLRTRVPRLMLLPQPGPDPNPPEIIYPTATVHANGYPDADVPFAFGV